MAEKDITSSEQATTDAPPLVYDERNGVVEAIDPNELIDRAVEKRILRKFDLRIFPLLTFCYFCSSVVLSPGTCRRIRTVDNHRSSMDLSNLGNAKSDSMSHYACLGLIPLTDSQTSKPTSTYEGTRLASFTTPRSDPTDDSIIV